MDELIEVEINSHVQKICIYANNLTIKIKKKGKIKSDLVFYELIFFFYFLDNAYYSINDYSTQLTSNVGPYLFKYLDKINRNDYFLIKDVVRRYCWDRLKIYGGILEKNKEKFTPDFFLEAFFYQSELMAYIKENNSFRNYNIPAPTLQEFIQKASINETIHKLNKLLVKNSNIFLDFLYGKN